MTKMWLDDVRPAPAGWVHVHSVNEAIGCLATGDVEVASLDHDLGDYATDGGDGIKVVDWMVEHGVHPEVHVHSWNPVGRDQMLRTIARYWPSTQQER